MLKRVLKFQDTSESWLALALGTQWSRESLRSFLAFAEPVLGLRISE